MATPIIDIIQNEWRLRDTRSARRRRGHRWPEHLIEAGSGLTDHGHPDRARLDRDLLVLVDTGDEDAGWALLATYPWIEPRLASKSGYGSGAAARLRAWIDAGVLSDGDVLEVAWNLLRVRARSWPERQPLDDYRWRYFGHFLARDVRRDLLARGRRIQPDHQVVLDSTDPAVEIALDRATTVAARWWSDPEHRAVSAEVVEELRAQLRPDQFSALAERSLGWTHSPDPEVSLPCWTARIHRGRKALGAVRPAA